jgi:ABC-type sugar transport system substrate-binding protein
MGGKIGLFVFDRVGEYHRRILTGVEDAARREGLALEVYDSGNIAAKQAQDLVRFASQGGSDPRCALVVPISDAVDDNDPAQDATFRLAQRILEKRVGWITLNHGRESVVSLLAARFPSLPVAQVSVDNEGFGRLQAQQLQTILPGGGTALCVRGNPFDSACRGRSLGTKAGLQGGRIVLEEVDGRWEQALGESVVHKWITSPIRREAPLHAVLCQNDEMGAGARQALTRAAQELGRPELRRVAVLGGDGLPGVGRKWVDEGVLTATVCVTLPGAPAVEMLAAHWRKAAPLPVLTRLAATSYPPVAELRAAAR